MFQFKEGIQILEIECCNYQGQKAVIEATYRINPETSEKDEIISKNVYYIQNIESRTYHLYDRMSETKINLVMNSGNIKTLIYYMDYEEFEELSLEFKNLF